MVPADELAFGVEPCLQHVVRHRPRPRGRDVVLAREDELHRLLDDVGDHGRLDGGVRPDAPAVAAAQQLQMDLDLVGRGLEHAGDHGGGQRLDLRAGPDLRRLAVLRDFGDGVHRLHLGVIGVLRPVGRLQHLGGAGERLVGIADLEPLHRLGGGSLPLRAYSSLAFSESNGAAAPRGVPLDLERVAAVAGGLDRVADDGDAERQRKNVRHVLDLHHLVGVDGPRPWRPPSATAGPRHRPCPAPARRCRTWRCR